MAIEFDSQLNLSHPGVVSTRFWHPVESGKLQCDLCPRACKLSEGQRGLCFVRARIDDEIVLTSYGRSSGFAVDPIEKKPLNHFFPGSSVLSFGTAGCNLACKFCQNWDISKSREMDTLMSLATPERIAGRAKSLACKSVAYTYNDPVIFHEYAIDTALACKEVGVFSVAVSAGYVCQKPREEFYSVMDAVNIDLKSFSEQFYYQITGAHLQPVLDTLLYIKHETDVWLEITTLLIPGFNDSDRELNEMTQWVFEKLGTDVPVHFTAFHPDYKMLSQSKTPPETLTRARDIALTNGLVYAYCGNVHDSVGGSSYCAHCKKIVIERDWYLLKQYNLTESGGCQNCGAQFHGRFDGVI